MHLSHMRHMHQNGFSYVKKAMLGSLSPGGREAVPLHPVRLWEWGLTSLGLSLLICEMAIITLPSCSSRTLTRQSDQMCPAQTQVPNNCFLSFPFPLDFYKPGTNSPTKKMSLSHSFFSFCSCLSCNHVKVSNQSFILSMDSALSTGPKQPGRW